MTAFDRLGRFVVRRAWWVVGRLGRPALVAMPLAPRVPGQLSAGGFILDDLESARAKALLETELGAPAVGAGRSSSAARRSRRARRRSRPPPRTPSATSRPRRTSPASSRTCWPRARSRPTATPPTTSSSSTCRPTSRPRRCRSCASGCRQPPGLTVELAGGPAFYGDVQTVSEADLRRSEIISLPLAALALLLVFGSVVAAGVPLVVGGSAVVVALAAIFFVASRHPDEHLRAEPRDAPRARARGRLLAADDEPVPRGAGARGRTARSASPEAVRATVVDGRTGRLLQRADRPARAARPGPVRVHDPALGRDRRRDRRRPGRRLGADPAAGGPDDPRAADRPAGDPAGRAAARLGRAVVAARARGHAPPGRACSSRPSAVILLLGSPVPARPLQRPGCVDPARRPCRPAPPSTGSAPSSARASSRRSCWPSGRRGPATTPANLAALYDYSRRLAADPRVTRVESLVDVDPRLTPRAVPRSCTARPDGPPDRYVADRPGGHDPGDLTAFTLYTPYGPNREEGKALVADLRDRDRAAGAAGRARPSSSVAAPRTSPTWWRGSAPTSRGPRCSS